jgi:hypothetical protein
MSSHGFPTRQQLEEGVIVDCHGSDDPDLRELRAARLKLHALGLRPLADEGLADIDVEVLAWLPGRRSWFRVGSYRGGLVSPWRAIDAALISDYLGRLAREHGLARQIDACGS